MSCDTPKSFFQKGIFAIFSQWFCRCQRHITLHSKVAHDDLHSRTFFFSNKMYTNCNFIPSSDLLIIWTVLDDEYYQLLVWVAKREATSFTRSVSTKGCISKKNEHWMWDIRSQAASNFSIPCWWGSCLVWIAIGANTNILKIDWSQDTYCKGFLSDIVSHETIVHGGEFQW